MKKCFHCGTEIPDDELFCSECGKEYVHAEETHEPLTADAVEVPAAEPVSEEPTEAAAVMTEEVDLEEILDAAEAEAEAVEPVAEKPAARKKMKWWYIAIPAVLAVVAAVLLGPLFIYLSPKTVLAKSFAETAKDLSARAEGTPIALMDKTYDESQKNTVTMDFNISQPMVGDMHLGMVAKIDSSIHQSHIGIQTNALGQELNMNLYMDREVAAVHVDRITGKNYYGIYYDTFGQDIRENEFMYDTIGEENIAAVEEMVDLVNQMMNLETVTPEQQAESLKKYTDTILTFMEEKDVAVGKATVSVDGKTENCKTVAFTISKDEYAELMGKLIDIAQTDPMMLYYYKSNTLDFEGEGWQMYLEDLADAVAAMEDDGQCTFTFYLHGGKVVQMDAAYAGKDTEWLCCVNFGSDASTKDIVLRAEFAEGEDKNAFEITLSTQKEGDMISETLCIVVQEGEEEPTELELGYEWNRQTGDMHLYAQEGDEEAYELDCVLTELENGYRLRFPGFGALMDSFAGQKLGVEMSAEISVTTGADIEVPKIKDIAKMTEMGLLGIAMKFMEFFEA